MTARSWIVGKNADCDIQVDNRIVSSQHCRLTERGESFLIEDMGSKNGTYVAGERISGPRLVRRGDPVTLGRNILLPWPAPAITITIGRDTDNNVVIPLDAVSLEHARLEREGDRVFLVDLRSTNGTAINDPLNKIKRALLRPTDAVFLGTHRVAAADLLAAMPPPSHEITAVERDRPQELIETGNHITASGNVTAATSAGARTSSTSWLAGGALSLICVALLLGSTRSCRHPVSPSVEVADAISSEVSRVGPGKMLPATSQPSPVAPAPAIIDPKRAPDAALIHKAADAVLIIGLRTDKHLALTKVTAWACRGNAIICPTAMLTELENLREERKAQDESIVVCTPTETVAVLAHKADGANEQGVSVATLELPLASACSVAEASIVHACLPGQKLAMLSAATTSHDPTTLVHRLTLLSIDRIDRDGVGQPLLFKCRYEGVVNDVNGAPVFDAAGRVVGCAQAVAIDAQEIHVIPVTRFAPLLDSSYLNR
jgi:pSer/pThr/pTyr-binding forkhead associated (FHA) protein